MTRFRSKSPGRLWNILKYGLDEFLSGVMNMYFLMCRGGAVNEETSTNSFLMILGLTATLYIKMRNTGAGFELGCLYGFIRLVLPFTNNIRLHSWPKFCQSYRTVFQTSWSYLGITHTIKLFSCGGGFIQISSDRDVPIFYLIMMCLGHHIDLDLHQLHYLSAWNFAGKGLSIENHLCKMKLFLEKKKSL